MYYEKKYSVVNPSFLLYAIHRPDNINDSPCRLHVSPPDQALQVSILNYNADMTFKPHYHKVTSKHVNAIQEAWVVMRGVVSVDVYDMDNSFIETILLEAGACFISYYCGHGYTILADDTYVYEFKTGPYLGQEEDKGFIDVQEDQIS